MDEIDYDRLEYEARELELDIKYPATLLPKVFPTLYKKILESPTDYTFKSMFMMIKTCQRINAGEITREQGDVFIGKILADIFVNPSVINSNIGR